MMQEPEQQQNLWDRVHQQGQLLHVLVQSHVIIFSRLQAVHPVQSKCERVSFTDAGTSAAAESMGQSAPVGRAVAGPSAEPHHTSCGGG